MQNFDDIHPQLGTGEINWEHVLLGKNQYVYINESHQTP